MSFQKVCDDCGTMFTFKKSDVQPSKGLVTTTRRVSERKEVVRTGFLSYGHRHFVTEKQLLIKKEGCVLCCPLCQEENVLIMKKTIVEIKELPERIDKPASCTGTDRVYCQLDDSFPCRFEPYRVGQDVSGWLV